MSEYTLKPCPFCGGKAEFEIKDPLGGIKTICVKCHNCKCQTKFVEQSVNYAARDKAAEAWNKRSSGWISTEDRLPETAGTYFVACCDEEYISDDNRIDHVYIETANYLTNWETWNLKSSVYVLAWLPIPELSEVIEVEL